MSSASYCSWQIRAAVLVLCFAACIAASSYLSLRPYLVGSPLIGHADQADIADMARSFAEGNGLRVNNVWLHIGGGLPGNKIPRPEHYWSIYTALAIAPFFYLFGANVVTMLIPALICKALIAALTAYWVWRLTQQTLPVVAAMVFVSFSPQMLGVVMGLSDIYLTLGVLVTGVLLATAIHRGAWWLFLLAGVACGFSIGMKPSGLLLFGVWLVYVGVMPGRRRIIFQGVLFLAGVIAALSPYAVYNQRHFGAFIQPGIPMVARAIEVRHHYYWEKGDPNALSIAQYSPLPHDDIPRASVSQSLSRYLDHFQSFLGQILIEGSVCPMWLTPFVFVGLFGLLWPLPGRKDLLANTTKLLMYFGLLMFGAGLVLAMRQHFEPRYWNFLFPFCVLVATPYLQKLPKTIYVAMIVIAVASGAMWSKKLDVRQKPAEYDLVSTLLPDDAVVLTANPWQFAFHTRIPAVATPYSADPSDILAMGERYNAEFLVFFGADGRHEMHRQLERGDLKVEALEPIYWGQRLRIFRMRHSQGG
jgi:4-amino-4-deoxy-L-arabinose transferase-like glycosyltransferase